MPLGNTLGQGILAQVRPGDEQSTGLRPLYNTVGLSYTLSISQYTQSLSLTYTIQKAGRTALLLFYFIQPTSQFAINSDNTIIAPDKVVYNPRSVVGHTLLAMPVIQGLESMIWSYSVLEQSAYQHLLSFYNPQNPTVLLTYPDKHGVWQQRQATMRPPAYGTATTVVYTDVVLTFTRLQQF